MVGGDCGIGAENLRCSLPLLTTVLLFGSVPNSLSSLKSLARICTELWKTTSLLMMHRRAFVDFEALSVNCLKSTVSWQGNDGARRVCLCSSTGISRTPSMLRIVEEYSSFLRPKAFLLLTLISFVSCTTGPSCQ